MRPKPNYGNIPTGIAEPGAAAAEFLRFDEVKRFVQSKHIRPAIWERLLKDLPDGEPLVVIGHSLGSIVPAGLLRRLPHGRVIDLFITVGSPLGFPRYHRLLGSLASEFPYDNIRRWLNVYSMRDPVTGGRGFASTFPQAVDCAANGKHELAGYMSHPAVAAAVGHTIFRHVAAASTRYVPARRLHPSWRAVLLSSAFSLQLSNLFSSKDAVKKLRFDAAREEFARRAIQDIEHQRQARVVALEQLRRLVGELQDTDIRVHPLADGQYPNQRDLTVDAARVLRGSWEDHELLALAVGLLMQPPIPPFHFEVTADRRAQALERTLNVTRSERGALSDQQFTGEVRESVDWAKKRLTSAGAFPWGTVLVGTSLALLAATGVGLVVAAPAGLAGAAVVTSTLAAFGPGGMVGGLLTLTTLTGTATSLGSLGAGAPARRRSTETGATTAEAVQSGEALAATDVPSLTVTLTSALAVVHAQTSLGFESTEDLVRMAINTALDVVVGELRIHGELTPGSESVKVWEKKVTLLIRALEALDEIGSNLPLVGEFIAATKAV